MSWNLLFPIIILTDAFVNKAFSFRYWLIEIKLINNDAIQYISVAKIARISITLLLLGLVVSGCMTVGVAHDTFIGDPVVLEFRVVHADLPNAMVYWYESPGNNESALIFNPPYSECSEVNFYVNPEKKNAKPLKENSKEVSLVTLDNASEEMALWARIPIGDKCAVLLSVGTMTDIGFTGISASTRSGHFKRVTLTFPEPKPPDTTAWPAVFFVPIFEALFWTGYVGRYPLARPLCPPVPESVEVSFHFPENISKKTVITRARANELVDDPGGACVMWCPSKICFSYWLKAAMLDLRLEFRRLNYSRNLTIENYAWNWNYRINGEEEIKTDYWIHAKELLQIDVILDARLWKGSTTGHNSSESYLNSPEYENDLLMRIEKGEAVPSTAWVLYLHRGQKPEDIDLVCTAADGGLIKAQNLLGKLYSNGEGVPQDLKKAYVWHKIAVTDTGLDEEFYDNSIRESSRADLILLKKTMTAEEIIEAENLYSNWEPGQCQRDLLEASSNINLKD